MQNHFYLRNTQITTQNITESTRRETTFDYQTKALSTTCMITIFLLILVAIAGYRNYRARRIRFVVANLERLFLLDP